MLEERYPNLDELWDALVGDTLPVLRKDSGISLRIGKDRKISRILFALDLIDGLPLLAQQMEIDAIVVHHSVGAPFYSSYCDVAATRMHLLQRQGYAVTDVDSMICHSQLSTRLAMRNANTLTTLAVYSRLGIACISAHGIADLLLQAAVEEIAALSHTGQEFADNLMKRLPKTSAFPDDEAVIMFGPLDTTIHPVYIDMCAVSPPSEKLLVHLLGRGCSCVVTSGAHEQAIAAFCERRLLLILLNHVIFDLWAMQLLRDRLLTEIPELDVLVLEETLLRPTQDQA